MYRLTKNYKLRNLHISNLWITVFSDNGEYITGLSFHERKPKGKKSKTHPVCEKAVKQIGEWFNGKRKRFNLPLDKEKIADSRLALQKIPYGKTVSFDEFAEMANFRGTMPVIQTVGQNPIPLILPCHRILKEGRLLGNYIGFSEYKNDHPRNLILKLALVHHEERNKGILACIRSLLCRLFC